LLINNSFFFFFFSFSFLFLLIYSVEEELKRKKEAIKKKLLEKYQKNQEEASNLAHLKLELDKIESGMVTDIAILREKIDKKDREVTYLHKKYKNAEEIYLNSKKEYEKASNEKIKLTEHLSIIIQENESRKAAKLEELLHQLDPESTNPTWLGFE